MTKGKLVEGTVRCSATAKHSGTRCKKAAIPGGTVCRLHGGAAKQVQRSARERFNDLVDPMINIAHKLVEEAEAGTLSASDRLGLMKFIADRTGFVPGKAVNIEGPARWEGTMTHIIKELPPDLVLEAEVIVDEQAEYEREKARQRESDERESRAQERDRARAALPQIGPSGRADLPPTIRVGSAEPPARQSFDVQE
ncbi:hypothetical protein [Microbacterium sp. NPDC079995]|uniref:hypothetical protein n=1 Tax=unclassified Microbacterium TaxID=2609290 RepID=UPI00344E3FB7